MKCPVCSTTDLLLAERHGIEIDYCPQCRGVWLDRGELDKIIERAAVPLQPQVHLHQPGYVDHERMRQGEPPHGYRHDGQGQHYRKKKSFLNEIFDFD